MLEFSQEIMEKSVREKGVWEHVGLDWYVVEQFVNNTVLAKEWKENFRMCKANFFKLCNELRPFLQKKSTTMRQAISVENKWQLHSIIYQMRGDSVSQLMLSVLVVPLYQP